MLSEGDITSFDRNTFSIYFPLPFRILFLFVLGFWLCGINFHYFYLVGIDIGPLIRYTRHVPPEKPLYQDVYKVAMVLSGVLGVGMCWFWVVTGGRENSVEEWEIVPIVVALICVGCMLLPGDRWHRRGRGRFLRMLRRVLIGGLDTDLRFADVLLADVVTSYAKVLGDTWIMICMSVVSRSHSITAPHPNRNCGGSWGVPLVMAIPSLIRLRQCLTDYYRSRGSKLKTGAKGTNGNGQDPNFHLWNAGKYASAFPVIIFSAVQREWDTLGREHWLSKMGIGNLWLLCVFINSSYSFYWDVTKDWDLPLFSYLFSAPTITPALSPTHQPPLDDPLSNTPWGLRATRAYHATSLYYIVIILDFLLRCTWSLKLSPHLGHVNDLEGGIFLLELLELMRRWMWMFLRVEKEWCARIEVGYGLSNNNEEESLELGIMEDDGKERKA